MPEQQRKIPCSIALMAHVDAGKTTLSEALLYASGTRRILGRVDHGDAYLDTHDLERARGITIFSKQAVLELGDLQLTLVDTPGHVDFSAEAERVMPILDCAVLVISAADGIQAHTLTLWRLLERYGVPAVLFVNKMDLPDVSEEKILTQLQSVLSPACAAVGPDFEESAAMCDEALLENYLQTGTVSDGNIRGLVSGRRLFPVCFGSALKMQGIEGFMSALERYLPRPQWPAAFAARVCKISRDAQGGRLTWLKITGGSLKVRAPICYVNQKSEQLEEKAVQLRLYSGEKFTALEEAPAGSLIAVTGLTETWAGQGLGAAEDAALPALEPVMTYRVNLPAGTDPQTALSKLRLLEEEDPQLHLLYQDGAIGVQIMGKVQLEVFRSQVLGRFGMDVTLDQGRIFYKETIENTVEGVGHFEPLRHYAEVHIKLEPLPRDSGLEFDTVCSADVLDASYQKLILTHMAEKAHRGVLTGAPITDVKMTLLVGRAHLKHTEGGDMRQATYRAIRQGLMQAKSLLLEPWYDFVLTLPTSSVGRAITDVRTMCGEFDAPESSGDFSVLKGKIPASELGDYADTLAAYTQGRGRLQLSLRGFEACHDQEKVVEEYRYDPRADLDNTPDSVFCAHGAGFNVPWDQVQEHMHLASALEKPRQPQILIRNLSMEDKELEAIMVREFGLPKTQLYRPPQVRTASDDIAIRPMKQQYILVDGYNIIFAWEELSAIAKEDLEAARRRLCDILSDYAGFKKHRIVLVFDGYKVKGNLGTKLQYHNIQVVYTRENETGDNYMESLINQIGPNYNIRVATSDGLVQLSAIRGGVLRMSARELKEEVEQAKKEMQKHY